MYAADAVNLQMGSHRYSEIGRTLGMLGEPLPWYWRLFPNASAWLLLTGFLLFSLSMDYRSANSTLRGNQQAMIAVAFVAIVLSYINCAIYSVRWRKTDTLLDAILLPYFGSSLIGLLYVVINALMRRLLPLDILGIAIIVISTLSTTIFGIAILYHWRHEIPLLRACTDPRVLRRKNRKKALDDTELQRRQLLKLYLKPADRAPTPDVTQGTFRIDLPQSHIDVGEEDIGVTAPRSAYDDRRTSSTPKSSANSLESYSGSGSQSSRLNMARPEQSRRGRDRRSLVELGDL